MSKCQWCGRNFEITSPFNTRFCSNKCKKEYEESKKSGGNHSDSGGGSKSGGCLKWAIIIFIVICALVALFSE